MLRRFFPRYLLHQFGQAILALKDNRLRTVLSVFGIAIGVAAVMLVAAVSKGGQYMVFSELNTFGLKSVWVFRDPQDKDPHRRIAVGSGIDNDDYRAIISACCRAVQRVSPVVTDSRKRLIQCGNQYSNGAVKGVGTEYAGINDDVIVLGRNFRQTDIRRRRAVAIIGPQVQADLYGANRDPIGREFRIHKRKFTVIGLLQAKSRDFLSSIGSARGVGDPNNRILVPYTIIQQELASKDIRYLHAEAVSLEEAETAASQLIEILASRHRQRFTYKSQTMAQYVNTANQILGGVAFIGVVAASISLLVGGMGIMNIMTTSVLERTREIGLRKALGARRADILLQFLAEAVAISTTGGLIGLVIGTIAGAILAAATGFPLTPSFSVVLIGLLVSTGVGVMSGYLPARRAASLHPVEALRYE